MRAFEKKPRTTQQSQSTKSTILGLARLGRGQDQKIKGRLQTRRLQERETGEATAPSIVHEVISSPGLPLDRPTHEFMRSRFGVDFSHVRVHTNSAAREAAHATRARAFALKNNIVFGAGQYAPHTTEGRHLLAHELVHTAQQATTRTVRREERQTGAAASSIVYMCSKDLETSPIGSHAFFRIGGPGRGNPTISLQPVDSSLGADCWQGIPARNYPSDLNADADCDATPIRQSCLEREFRAYPIGHYCTWGPNSNTFVGVVARNCGMINPDPPGWTPGIDDGPPPNGTYAPDKWTTLISGCETKQCIIGPENPGGDPVIV